MSDRDQTTCSLWRDLRAPLILIVLGLVAGVGIGECRHQLEVVYGAKAIEEIERFDDHNVDPLEEPR